MSVIIGKSVVVVKCEANDEKPSRALKGPLPFARHWTGLEPGMRRWKMDELTLVGSLRSEQDGVTSR